MYETIIHAPDRTVTVEERRDRSEEETHEREIDIRDINWEDIYQSFLEANFKMVDSEGWATRKTFATVVAIEYGFSDIVGHACVELAAEEGFLAIKPGNRSRVRGRKHERIEIKAGGEIRIAYSTCSHPTDTGPEHVRWRRAPR